MMRVDWILKEPMNFEKCLESFKENLVIHPELNKGVALVHHEL